MKIEFNVDASKVADDLKEILQSLSPEERKDIARQVMNEWLRQPIEAERKAWEDRVLASFKDGSRGSGALKDASDQKIREHWDYKHAIDYKNFKSTREEMVQIVTSATIENYKAAIKEMVSTDEHLKAVMDKQLEAIKANFGNFVHDAMIAWFCSNMAGIQSQIMMASARSESALEAIKQVTDQQHQINNGYRY